MKQKYVVAYLNMNEGEIEMQEVDAKDEQEAFINVLGISAEVFNTPELIYEYCLDTDSYISAYKL